AGPSELINYVTAYYNPGSDARDVSQGSSRSVKPVDRKFLEKVWEWLTRHPQLQVGEDGWANNLSLPEVEIRNAVTSKSEQKKSRDHASATSQALTASSTAKPSHKSQASMAVGETPNVQTTIPLGEPEATLRIYATTERRWQAITGHAFDSIKVPGLDFACLSIIAAHRERGILQPDLVRISGQDKRSVPERTRRLHAGGYISKIPVLINKSHTSKLTLTRYVRSSMHNDGAAEADADTTQILREGKNSVANLVDFDHLQRKIFDLLRVSKLMAIAELKDKLGITGLRWPMRILASHLRRLENLGCIKQVRAYPEGETTAPFLFRCAKYIRDPEGKEWRPVVYPARGRLKTTEAVQDVPDVLDVPSDEEQDYQAEETQYLAGLRDGRELRHLKEVERPIPEWSGDNLLGNLLYDLVRASGSHGISTLDLKNHSLGCFIVRPTEHYLSRLVEMWQVSQPLHLRHLAIVRDATLTNGIPHYIHYTFQNFQKLVDEDKASWDSIMTITKDHKQYRSVAAIDAEPDLDQNGFPQLADTLFQGRHNDASLTDCAHGTHVKLPSHSNFDPEAVPLEDGSWTIGKTHTKSSTYRPATQNQRKRPLGQLEPEVESRMRVLTARKPRTGSNLVVGGGGRGRSTQAEGLPVGFHKLPLSRKRDIYRSQGAARKYKKAKLVKEIDKRLSEGQDRFKATRAVLTLAVDQYSEIGQDPPWDIIEGLVFDTLTPSILGLKTLRGTATMDPAMGPPNDRQQVIVFRPSTVAHSRALTLSESDSANGVLYSRIQPFATPPLDSFTQKAFSQVESGAAHVNATPSFPEANTALLDEHQRSATFAKGNEERRADAERINTENGSTRQPISITPKHGRGKWPRKKKPTGQIGVTSHPMSQEVRQDEGLSSSVWLMGTADNHWPSVNAHTLPVSSHITENRRSPSLKRKQEHINVTRQQRPKRVYRKKTHDKENESPSAPRLAAFLNQMPLTHSYQEQLDNILRPGTGIYVSQEVKLFQPGEGVYKRRSRLAVCKSSRILSLPCFAADTIQTTSTSNSARSSHAEIVEAQNVGNEETTGIRLPNETAYSRILTVKEPATKAQSVTDARTSESLDAMEDIFNGQSQGQADPMLSEQVEQGDPETAPVFHSVSTSSSRPLPLSETLSSPRFPAYNGGLKRKRNSIDDDRQETSLSPSTHAGPHADTLASSPAMARLELPRIQNRTLSSLKEGKDLPLETGSPSSPLLSKQKRSRRSASPSLRTAQISTSSSYSECTVEVQQWQLNDDDPVARVQVRPDQHGRPERIAREEYADNVPDAEAEDLPAQLDLTSHRLNDRPVSNGLGDSAKGGLKNSESKSKPPELSSGREVMTETVDEPNVDAIRDSLPRIMVEETQVQEGDYTGLKRMRPQGGTVAALRKKVIMGIVEKCGGIYPGIAELGLPFKDEWGKSGQSGTVEKRTLKATVKALCESGKLRHLQFSFKDPHGLVVTRSIITVAEISPTDPKIKEAESNIIGMYPAAYIPDGLAISNGVRDTFWHPRGEGRVKMRTAKDLEIEEELVHLHQKPGYIERYEIKEKSRQQRKAQEERQAAALRTLMAEGRFPPGDMNYGQDVLGSIDSSYNRQRLLAFAERTVLKDNHRRVERLASLKDGLGMRSGYRKSQAKSFQSDIRMEPTNDLDGSQQSVERHPSPAPLDFSRALTADNFVNGLASQLLEERLHQLDTNDLPRSTNAHHYQNGYRRLPTPQDTRAPKPYHKSKLNEASQKLTFRLSENALSRAPSSAARKLDRGRRKRQSDIDVHSLEARQLLGCLMYPEHGFHPSTRTFSVDLSRSRTTAQKPQKSVWQLPPVKTFHDLVDDMQTFELSADGLEDVKIDKWSLINLTIPHSHQTVDDRSSGGKVAWYSKLTGTRGYQRISEQSESVHGSLSEAESQSSCTSVIVSPRLPTEVAVFPATERLSQKPLTTRRLTTVAKLSQRPGPGALSDHPEGPVIRNRFRRQTAKRRGHVLTAADVQKVLTAVIVVRTLAGGVERHIDWVLVAKAVEPEYDQAHVQKLWPKLLQAHKVQAQQIHAEFQKVYLKAYQDGSVPPLDYEQLQSYDWAWLVSWTVERLDTPVDTALDLPLQRTKLDELFQLTAGEGPTLDTYFELDTGSTIVRREAELHRKSWVHPLGIKGTGGYNSYSAAGDQEIVEIAKTWIRANVATKAETYDPQSARDKLARFDARVIDQALTEMLASRTLAQENKGRLVPGRNYDLNENYLKPLRKKIEVSHLLHAPVFKREIDKAVIGQLEMVMPKTAEDGFILAIQNMQAHRRVSLIAQNPPMAKYGLADRGRYKTRLIDKSKLLFDVEVRGTESYVQGNPLLPLPPPPSSSSDTVTSRIPLWYDINGELIIELWQLAVAAVMSIVVIRPGLSIQDVEPSVRPTLAMWELHMIFDWMVEARLMERMGHSCMPKEWWWLCLDSS
ncbi:MAG: hypothetical protein Q9220_006679, partial [cf. Caloplaca sp. 1 TL-2023]